MDKEALLKELDKIQEQRNDRLNNGLGAVINELNSALGSPRDTLDLYQKCVFSNQFEGGKQDTVEFEKWKTDQGEKIKDPSFVNALQFHIQYLIFTLKRVSGEENGSLIKDLISYVQNYRQQEETFLDQPKDPLNSGNQPKHGKPRDPSRDQKLFDALLQHSVAEGPFAKHYQIEKQLADIKNWEMNPGDSKGIEEQAIFPELRRRKDPSLLTLWDQRIQYEKDRSELSGLSEDKSRFDSDVYPGLLWSRGKDQIILGDESGGLQALMGVIRTYSLNASFEKWSGELRDILNDKPINDDGSVGSPTATPPPVPAN